MHWLQDGDAITLFLWSLDPGSMRWRRWRRRRSVRDEEWESLPTCGCAVRTHLGGVAAVYDVGDGRVVSVGRQTFSGASVQVVHRPRLLMSTLVVTQGERRAVARRLEWDSVPELFLDPDPWYEGEPWGAWYPLDILAYLSSRPTDELRSNPSGAANPADFVERRGVRKH